MLLLPPDSALVLVAIHVVAPLLLLELSMHLISLALPSFGLEIGVPSAVASSRLEGPVRNRSVPSALPTFGGRTAGTPLADCLAGALPLDRPNAPAALSNRAAGH